MAESYGLPPGSAINYNALGFPAWVDDLCRQWGIDSSTYPGHQEKDRRDLGAAPNPDRLNRGIDWAGEPETLLRFAKWCVSQGPPRTSGVYGPPGVEMVIYQHPRSGERVWYPSWVDYSSDFGGHTDHVHIRTSAALIDTAPPPPVLSRTDRYALAVITEGRDRSVSRKGICIALTVPPVETTWRNLANTGDPETQALPNDGVGSDHDSAGLFQQRRAWGPALCRMDPYCAAGLFYDGGQGGQDGLLDYPYDTDAKSPGMWAADVQEPAAEYRYRYDEHWDEANKLYDRLIGITAPPPEEDDMFTDTDRENLAFVRQELSKPFSERSMYRTDNVPDDTVAGMALFAEAFGWDWRVESSALRGEAWAVDLVRQAAAGTLVGVLDKDGKPDAFLVEHANAVLNQIMGVTPGVPPSPTGPPVVTPPTSPPVTPPVVVPPSPQKITLLTAQGHMADMWTGYPADLARAMDPNRFYHQPIGNWDAFALPLGPPVDAGYREGVNLLTAVHPSGPFALCGYSQGAEVTSRLYMAMADGGELAHRRDDFVGGVTFGNPMREEGSFVGRDPGGHGIASTRIVGTGPLWKDYADPGDVYTSVSGPSGDDMTAIYDLAERVNPLRLMAEILQMFTNPAPELLAAATAIIQFIQFGATNPITKAHVSYQWAEVTSGVSYFDHAVGYMRSVGDRARSTA